MKFVLKNYFKNDHEMWSGSIKILAIWSAAFHTFPAPKYDKLPKLELLRSAMKKRHPTWCQDQSWSLTCTRASPAVTRPHWPALAGSWNRPRRPSGDKRQCRWHFSVRIVDTEWRNEASMPDLVTKTKPNKRSNLTQVVVFVLWSMKKGRPFGAILISQPGGRKLCVTLCCGLGEL